MPTATITNAGLNLMRDALKGAGNPRIKYIAFGSGTATPAATDTKLGNELLRKAITGYANGANAGEVIVSGYLGAGELVGADIEEIGIFAGDSATTNLNTGTLLARARFTQNPKAGTQSIPVTLDFSL
jgi:hypothetical protein